MRQKLTYIFFWVILGCLFDNVLIAKDIPLAKEHLYPVSFLKSKITNDIIVMHQAKDGRYWFGIRERGLYSYNGLTATAYLPDARNPKNSLTSHSPFSITEDSEGNIYSIGDGGITKISPSGRLESWQKGFEDNYSLPVSGLYSSYFEKDVGLFAAGGKTILKYNREENSFEEIFDIRTVIERASKYNQAVKMIRGFTPEKLLILFRRTGLYEFDLKENSLKAIPIMGANKIFNYREIIRAGDDFYIGHDKGVFKLNAENLKAVSIRETSTEVRNIAFDGRFLFFGDGDSVIKYQISTKVSERIKNKSCKRHQEIFIDLGGDLWSSCGSEPYSIQKTPANSSAYNLKRIAPIGSLITTDFGLGSAYLKSNGDMVLQADDGYKVTNKAGGVSAVPRTHKKSMGRAIAYNGDYIAYGYSDSLDIFKNDKRIFTYQLASQYSFENLFFLGDGSLLAITFEGLSLIINPPYKEVSEMPKWMSGVLNIFSPKHGAISPDKKWLTLFVGGDGLYALDFKNETIVHKKLFVDFPAVTSSGYFMQAGNDYASVFGRSYENIRYNYKTQEMSLFTTPTLETSSIHETHWGDIYFPFEGPPLFVDKKTSQTIPLLALETSSNIITSIPLDNSYFGGEEFTYVSDISLLTVNLKTLSNNLSAPRLFLDRVVADNKTIKGKEFIYYISENSDSIIFKLRLNHFENAEYILKDWSFRFNKDGKWNKVTEPKISLFNPAPGEYFFQIRNNSTGAISNEASIIIKPNWYNTGLFKFSMIAVGFFIAAILIINITKSKFYKKESDSYKAFAGRVSHELRSSLLSIITKAEIQAQEAINQGLEIPKDIAQTLFAAKQMLSIIDVLLQDAKLSAGDELMLEWRNFNVRKQMKDMEGLCQYLGEAKNVTIRYIVSDESPEYFRSDTLRIYQMLLNLIKNAVEHANERSAVKVLVEAVNDGIKYSVINVGECISPEMIKEIIKDNVSLKEHAGMGFGLHLCNLYSIGLGEPLLIKSEGPGTTFSFVITPR